MKHIIVACLVIFLSSSCKKNRNCLCNTTIQYNQGQLFFSSNNKPMTEKMSEKEAKAVCDHEAENIEAMYYNFDTNNGNYPSSTTFITHCTLQ